MKKILTVLFLLAPFSAHATIIDFEGHSPTNDGALIEYQAGFTFSFSASGWGIFVNSFAGGGAPYTSNGTERLMAAGGSATVTMSASDSSLFSISALDAATMFPNFSGTISIVGTLFDGSAVTQSLSVSDTFSSFSLNPDFSMLKSISFSETLSGPYGSTPGLSLDNLVVNKISSVPEPSAFVLLGLGLVGVSLSRKKKSI